ncbi:MAG: P-loop NTPase, partial [Myxococcota bacterium]
MAVTEQAVVQALGRVRDPERKRTLLELEMIQDIRVDGDAVTVGVELINPAQKAGLEPAVKAAVEGIGAKAVTIDWSLKTLKREIPPDDPCPGVENIVLVTSGKGGVGKSTVATNMTLALKRAGHRVGLLDADMYGPSIPTMLGVSGRPAGNAE